MLAPCMTKILLGVKTTDPLKLIPIVIDAAVKFDEEDVCVCVCVLLTWPPDYHSF